MTPERWRQIERLYHAALEHAPDERKSLLDETCAGDEALRRFEREAKAVAALSHPNILAIHDFGGDSG